MWEQLKTGKESSNKEARVFWLAGKEGRSAYPCEEKEMYDCIKPPFCWD